MGKSLRLGLIGTGSISQLAHIPAWTSIEDVEVVGIADPDDEARASASARLGDNGVQDVSTYVNHGALIEEEDLDAVDITIPAGPAKREAIRAAVQAGLHVTCQKPFVRDFAAGTELATLAAERGITLSVNQQARFGGAFSKVKSIIDSETLGSLRTIRLSSDFPFAGRDRAIGFSVHNFDLLRYWTGQEPSRVNAWHKRQTSDDRFVFGCWIAFEDGTMAQVWDELSSSTTLRWAFRVGGSDGTVRGHEAYSTEMIPPEVVYTPAGDTVEKVTPITSRYVPDAFVGYFERFVDALLDDGIAPTTATDNLESLRIAFAARESAERGEWVDVRAFDG